MTLETQYYKSMLELVSKSNPTVAHAILDELKAQRSRLKLIASENYNSMSVIASMGESLVDKYAEGNVGKRYYAGCEQVDVVEDEARKLACELFGAEYAYVQPCSGSDANLIAYYAIVRSFRDYIGGDHTGNWKPKLLSLDVNCGGHLTHSNPMNIVNELFNVVTYGVNDDGWIDYDNVEDIALKELPDVILAGYSAYPRALDFKRFREIADKCSSHRKCGAEILPTILMCDMAHFAGLVAGKIFTGVNDPIPYCDIVTSTTQKTLKSGRGGIILAKGEWEEYIKQGCPIAMGGPLNNMVASKAVGFKEAMSQEFRDYAKQLVKNTKALANSLMEHGIKLQTNGTDNHLILINLTNTTLNGRQAENALLDCGIVVNRNSIPNDPNGSWYTSGLRIGPAALTSLGMKEFEMEKIATLIASVLQCAEPNGKAGYKLNSEVIGVVQDSVKMILEHFPLYPEIDINELEKVFEEN